MSSSGNTPANREDHALIMTGILLLYIARQKRWIRLLEPLEHVWVSFVVKSILVEV